ncbi:MAG: hypothetical protein Kow00102_03110 [Spirochaetota bacterium]|nr:hypothetical protein [Spirochaetota bacterium]
MRKRVKTEILNNTGSIPRYDEQPAFFKVKYFVCGKSGRFSKRAFFFSVFAVVALVYCGLCIAGCVVFDTYLGAFILGCNAAFGINYYANEKLADVQ